MGSFLYGARDVNDLGALVRGRDYRRPRKVHTIRIEKIVPESAESPGFVWYEIVRDGGWRSSTIQPFRRAPGPDGGHRLVWQAEGPDDALTLTPSFKAKWPGDEELLVHLFLRDGKIELCGDSTVQLAP